MKLPILLMMAGLFTGATAGSDDSTVTVKSGTLERIEQLLDRTGVRIGGELSTGHFGSRLRGDEINPVGRSSENNEYSTVDLHLHACVNKYLGGRAVLRLHHNWQNFWSDPGNPLFTRWLSVDGSIAELIDFHAGDFTTRWTPLTMWMPQNELLYEPHIARRMRQAAMDESFLGEQRRPLEGVNLSARIPLGFVTEKLDLDIIGTRLRSAGTAPVDGSTVVTNSRAKPLFSKYCAGVNGDLRFKGGLLLGGTHLRIIDHVREIERDDPVTVREAQHTAVSELRINWDAVRYAGDAIRQLKLFADAAFSADDSGWYEEGRKGTERLCATAARCGIEFDLTLPVSLTVSGEIHYLRNEEGFRNELAQSPAFIGRRIMNIEGDSTDGSIVFPNHYSTFDARYHSVFKFCPSMGTNMWHKAPFTKNSYSANVYTMEELESVAGLQLDPALQLVMPFGAATPDRQGVRMNVVSRWNDCLELQLLFSYLEGVKYTVLGRDNAQMKKFGEFGAGLRFDVSRYVSWIRNPLVFSCSQTENRIETSSTKIRSTIISADLLWRTGKYVGFSAGIQRHHCFRDHYTALVQSWIAGGCSLFLTRQAAVHMTISRTMTEYGGYGLGYTPFRYNSNEFRQIASEVVFDASF